MSLHLKIEKKNDTNVPRKDLCTSLQHDYDDGMTSANKIMHYRSSRCDRRFATDIVEKRSLLLNITNMLLPVQPQCASRCPATMDGILAMCILGYGLSHNCFVTDYNI